MSLSPNPPQSSLTSSGTTSTDEGSFPGIAQTSSFYAQGRMTVLCTVLAIYSFLVGVSVLRGTLPWNSAHFFFVPVPFALVLWYGYGFMQPSPESAIDAQRKNEPDFGLLLLCAGWALITLALMMPSPPAPSAANFDVAASPVTISTITAIICSVLGMVSIAGGSVLSIRNWRAIIRKV